MEIGWNFPGNNYGTTNGIADAGIETFRGNLFGSLAREICQNSLDAILDSSKPVRVVFELEDVEVEKIPDVHSLRFATRLCKNFWDNEKKSKKFFENAVHILSSNSIRVMKISDYNTTGLTGSDKDRNSPWNDLVKSSGVSNKTGEAGGSYGIGKNAPFACSDLRTIFYSTLDKNGLRAYQGVANLASFEKMEDEKKIITQGRGYYGIKMKNNPVFDSFNLCGSERVESGTDLYVLGFIENENWKNEIIKSILEGFLIGIIKDNLEVDVQGITINSKNLDKLMEKYRDDIPLTANYYDVLRSKDSFSIEHEFENLGTIELKILMGRDFKRKVMMSRSNGMKIFDQDRLSGTIRFSGVCFLKDEKINSFFREMENPQHNGWEDDRHSNKKLAKENRLRLYRFIKQQVQELGKTTVLDEMDAVGAGEFLPDDIGNGEQAKKESLPGKVKDYTKISFLEDVKMENSAGNQGNGLLCKEEFVDGEISDYGALDSVDYIHNAGNSSDEDNTNENALGEPGGESNGKVRTQIYVNPEKIRFFLIDSKKNRYKLSFTPDKTVNKAFLDIYAAGEQKNHKMQVKDAKDKNGKHLKFWGNRIYIGRLVEGKKYQCTYTINYDEICSMEVNIVGNKI